MAELQNAVLKTDSPTNNALQTITSAALEPQAFIAYSTPKEVPLPAIPEMEIPPLMPTGQETKATDLSSRIQGLNEKIVGKSAFKTEQEAAAGLPALTQEESDLGAQLSSLINESRQIPQQLQLDATGRGITAGGLAPLQTARLRTNAIQALGVSSLLDAVKGRLASAQMKVDRAVKAKYEPIEEEIAALTKNLDLILKDPRTTLEDKNRAEAQKLLQEKRTQAIVKKKEDMATIMSWAAAALANGASPLVAQKLTNLAQSENPDLRTALALYAPYARDPQAVEKAVLDLELQRANIANVKANTARTNAEIEKVNADTEKKRQELAPSADKLEKADSVISQIDGLLNDPNLSKAIGPVSANVPEWMRSGARNDVDANIDQLIASVAIENLALLKGPMSDKDVTFIKEASAGLKKNMSEAGFKKKLEGLKAKFEEIKARAGSTSSTPAPSAGTTRLIGPDGIPYDVPNDKVDAFLKAGGKRP